MKQGSTLIGRALFFYLSSCRLRNRCVAAAPEHLGQQYSLFVRVALTRKNLSRLQLGFLHSLYISTPGFI